MNVKQLNYCYYYYYYYSNGGLNIAFFKPQHILICLMSRVFEAMR